MPKDKIVDKYITNVTIVNDNPEFQKYMSEEEDKKKIQNSLLSEARENGINDGISKEKVSIAKNLLSMNISVVPCLPLSITAEKSQSICSGKGIVRTRSIHKPANRKSARCSS